MERILSQEERIRRAEEIYYRRKLNNGDIRMPSSQVRDKTEKRQFSLYRKMAIQILICILIYLIFSLIKEANYLFSENIINKTKESDDEIKQRFKKMIPVYEKEYLKNNPGAKLKSRPKI